MPSNIFGLVFDSLSAHHVHSSKEGEMAGFPHSRVAQKASEFYSLVMVNKNQWILGACALLFLRKCQGVYGWAGTIRAAKVLETISLSLVPQRVYGMTEVFCTVTLESRPNAQQN